VAFLTIKGLELREFRPGLRSHAILGNKLVMAIMELEVGFVDPGHAHPNEQCGYVLQGELEMAVGDERQTLKAGDAYFVPGDALHSFRVRGRPVLVLDVSTPREG